MHPDQKTLEELNTPRSFQEFPKMLHHPDGHTKTVNSAAEEEAAGSEWQPTPQDALDLKTAREQIAKKAQDKAIADALQEKAAKEAKEAAAEEEAAKGKGKGK